MESKYNFTGMDRVFFNLQSIACGEWRLVDLNKKSAFDYLANFCKTFPKDEDLAQGVFERAYYLLQIELFVIRPNTFENIQVLPPFNLQGKENLLQLLRAAINKGLEGLEQSFAEMFGNKPESRGLKFYIASKNDPKIIRILSGNGESMDTAVKFSTADIEKRVRAEHWFIIYTYGREGTDWERGVHYTVPSPENSKLYSLWNVTLSDGTRKKIYFDTNRED